MIIQKSESSWYEVLAGPGAIFQVRAESEEEALSKTDNALEKSISGIAPYVGMLALNIEPEEKRIAEHIFQTTNGPEVILKSFKLQETEFVCSDGAQEIVTRIDENQQQLDLEGQGLRKVVTIAA